MDFISEDIAKYSEDYTTPESSFFKNLVKETYEKTDAAIMQVGHLEGAFLRVLVRLLQAKHVLEIGTFTGYSALAMAEGLPEDGKLITCEINPLNTEIAQKYFSESEHGEKIELKFGNALEIIPTLTETFDMAFIDAEKEDYIKYWEGILPKIRKGGIIVADNVLWSGRVLNPQDESDFGICEFNEHVKNDDRVEQVLLPIRDGITIAWKK